MSEVTRITTSNEHFYVEGKIDDIAKNIQKDEEEILGARMYLEIRAAEWFEFKKLEPTLTMAGHQMTFCREGTVKIKTTAIQCLESMGDCDIR